jgi:hypothetical protein
MTVAVFYADNPVVNNKDYVAPSIARQYRQQHPGVFADNGHYPAGHRNRGTLLFDIFR